ncbi:MAG: cytochrome c biogenesis protein ResB [Cellulomonadaceae bacterium]
MSQYRPEGIQDEFVDPPGSAGDGPALPALGAVGWARWAWRQLTSMRVALLLLMLLAVAAVPGSTLPQRPQDPVAVAQYLQENPTLGAVLDAVGAFDVYGSVWFSAIYLLLFISLVGCILPRTRVHLRALRARPPRVPRRFARFPAQGRRELPADAITPAQAAAAAAAELRGRWARVPLFRVDEGSGPAPADADPGAGTAATVAAERGYLRETGNLVFHLSLLGLLIAVAIGQAFQFRGQAIVVQDRGFVNSVSDYDTFERGSLFREGSLVPFSMVLDDFEAEFTYDVPPQSRDFTAYVTVREPEAQPRAETIKVNHPIVVGGAKVYLQGNGYAPDVEVRDGAGEIAFSGPVPFIPEDEVYTSRGVIKVPDVSTGEQIGLIGYLLPSAEITEQGVRSVYPQPLDPVLVLTVWTGDLGLDDGVPQNVYELDTTDMTQALEPDGDAPVTLVLRPGETVSLPDGLGELTFRELPRFVALDLRHDPAVTWVLVFSLAALGGLTLSLFTPRRRVWVKAWTEAGAEGTARTVVTVAGLARSDDAGLQAQVDGVLAAVDRAAGACESSDRGAGVTEPERTDR